MKDERRSVEASLGEGEKRYRDLVEALPQVVFEVDEHGNLIYVNHHAYELFGQSKEDLADGPNILDRVVPEDRERLKENIRRILAGERPDDSEYRLLRKDGSILQALIYSCPPDPQLRPARIRGILVDITERKRMEEKLRKLSHAVEQSPVSVVITDRHGLIEYVNPKFSELTGYTVNEVIGKNPRILKSGEMPSETYQQLWATITSGRDWEGQLHNRKKNGDLYWERVAISPITDSNGKITHFVAIKEDVTERRRLEQQLFQAQKMEAVGRLAGGVAHDFNNVLTVILSCSDLVLNGLDEKSPMRSEIEQIREAGKRAANLTSQLLAFSRKQIRSPQVLDLNAVVSQDERMLRRLIGEDVEVVLRLSPDIGRVYTDPVQLEQIIINLAVNARDAMPTGGKLVIETADVTLDENYARDHLTVKPGPYVLLAVSDSGCGMTREVQAHLFEPFFTTKEHGKGTGLGLSTVYGIVKQNDGYIWVYSEPGQGTTFKIYLPAVKARAVSPPRSRIATEESQCDETILIVEDDPFIRSLASRILSDRGYSILEAHDAVDASTVSRKHQGPIHLLLTDVVLPGASGKQLARSLAEARPEMRVLYTSGYTDDAIIRHGILEAGIAFLQKPFTPEVLRRRVREALAKA